MMFHFLFFLLFHFYFFSISSSYCSKSFQIKHLNNLPSYSTLYNTNSKFTIPSIKLPTINLFKSNIKEKNHEEISSKVNNNHTLDLKKINSTISYSIDPEKEKQLLQDLGLFYTDNYWDKTNLRLEELEEIASKTSNQELKDKINNKIDEFYSVLFTKRLNDINMSNITYIRSNSLSSSSIDELSERQKPIDINDIRQNYFLNIFNEMLSHFNYDNSLDEYYLKLQQESIINEKNEYLQSLRSKNFLLYKILPYKYYQYVDFYYHLQSPSSASITSPSPQKIVSKNLLISFVLGFLMLFTEGTSQSFLLTITASFVYMSLLLTRGMPKDYEKKYNSANRRDSNSKIIFWSKTSFFLATSITFTLTLLSYLSSYLINYSLLSTLNHFYIKNVELFENAKLHEWLIKISCLLAVISTGYYTSFYHVFEKSSEDGVRWKKFQQYLNDNTSNYLDEFEEILYTKSGFKPKHWTYPVDTSSNNEDVYSIPVSEDDSQISQQQLINKDSSYILNDDQFKAEEEYQSFLNSSQGKKIIRKKPLQEIPEEWENGMVKNHLNISNTPSKWITKAVTLSSKLIDPKWLEVKTPDSYYESPNADTETTTLGPPSFRELRPLWMLKNFVKSFYNIRKDGNKEKAREYGIYRRGMRKKDPKVKVKKWDGVGINDINSKK